MDAKIYLRSFGWKDGDALQSGGIKKPILVKHKKDTKGLGNEHNDADKWWERLFDGQLKNLEVTQQADGSTSFKQNQDQVKRSLRKDTSPLYRMFVKGEVLEGTVGKQDHNRVKDIKIDNTQVIEEVESVFVKGSKKRVPDTTLGTEQKKSSSEKTKKSKSKSSKAKSSSSGSLSKDTNDKNEKKKSKSVRIEKKKKKEKRPNEKTKVKKDRKEKKVKKERKETKDRKAQKSTRKEQ